MIRSSNTISEINLGTPNDKLNIQNSLNTNQAYIPEEFVDDISQFTQSFIGDRLNQQYKYFENSNLKNTTPYRPKTVINRINLNKDIKQSHLEELAKPTISIENANYFTETPIALLAEESLPIQSHNPEGFLIEPYARKGTSRTQFGNQPCGGGVQGPSKYITSPGEKTKVQWIIKNPAKNGLCQINLSRGHPDDISTYQTLTVNSPSLGTKNGKFECGDQSKEVEEIIVELPNITCSEWTLQWIYEAPGYGTLYEWADISILNGGNAKEWTGKCQNEGVCVDGKCFWAAGYFGQFCDYHGMPNTFYESVDNDISYPINSNSGMSVIGWYFIILLIALLLAGWVFAMIFFVFRKRATDIIKGSKPARDSRVFSPEVKMNPLSEENDSDEEAYQTESQLQNQRKEQEERKRKQEELNTKELQDKLKEEERKQKEQEDLKKKEEEQKRKEELEKERQKKEEQKKKEEEEKEKERKKKLIDTLLINYISIFHLFIIIDIYIYYD